MKHLTIEILLMFAAVHGFGQDSKKATVTNVMNFDWSRNGRVIYFTAIRMDAERRTQPAFAVCRYDLKKKEISLVVKDARNPKISRDGKRMAMVKSKEGNSRDSDIFVYDLGSQQKKLVVGDTTREGHPSWSPDGHKLVYTVVNWQAPKPGKTLNINLWVIDLRRGVTKQIANTPFACFDPVWAPRGNKIVYYLEKGDNHDQIYLTDEAGSFHTNLTSDTTTHNIYPSWFGGRIIYTRQPGQIISMSESGEDKKLLEGLNAFMTMYNQSTDKIAFLTRGSREKPSDLMIYDVKTKKVSGTFSRDELNQLTF